MKDRFLQALLTASATGLVILVILFIFGKVGPGLPLSVVNTNKSDFFTSMGEGKVYAKPDVAMIQIGYASSANTVGAAQNQANETINKVTNQIKALGIADADIQTTNYSINPNFNNSGEPMPVDAMEMMPSRGGAVKITGYNINVNMQIKVRDFQKINQVIDVATANGANQVGGLSFTVDDPKKFQNEARKKAIADAKENASVIAGETGLTLGKIVNVYESTGGPGNFPYAMTKDVAMSADGAPTEIQPGQTEITSQVTLSYETR